MGRRLWGPAREPGALRPHAALVAGLFLGPTVSRDAAGWRDVPSGVLREAAG